MSDGSAGPDIAGLTFIEHLGSGGYSEVYLYEQRKPRMRVAVKVLTDARLSDRELSQFAAEAETMAELADHPYIVQVFTTGVTDDGRPYLVMKYYPPPNLGQRAATERFSVSAVLRTGIQISSAVETAHRVGIVHRDIKPANILVSQYGEPGLADFGIAGKAAEPDGDEDLGVSIPWSPPEVLSGASNGSVASDVYSLAATLWHLLAGRSPYEAPGGDNSPRALMGRILRSVTPATGRADAPPSLERLLRQAMSKQPELRPNSALEFARGLQMVEQELRYARTEIVVDGAAPVAPRATEAQSVRPPTKSSSEMNARFAPSSPQARSVAPSSPRNASPPTTVRPARPTVVTRPALAPPPTPAPVDSPATTVRPARPATPASLSKTAPSMASQSSALRPHERPNASAVETPPTTRRPAVPAELAIEPKKDDAAARRGVKTPVVIIAAAVVVVAAVIVGIVVMASGSNQPSARDTPSGPVGTDQGGLSGVADVVFPTVSSSYDVGTSTLTFTWTRATGTGVTPKYAYWLKDSAQGTQSTVPTQTTKTTAQVKTATPSHECIEVGVVLTDGSTASDQNWTCGR